MNKIYPLLFKMLRYVQSEPAYLRAFDERHKAGKPVVEEHRKQMYARCGHAVGVKPRERCLVESCWNHGSFAEEESPTPEFWKHHMKEVREILEPPAIEGMKTTINKLEGELHGAKEKIKELEKQVWERTEEIKVASVTMENLRTIRKELEAKLKEAYEKIADDFEPHCVMSWNAALEDAAKGCESGTLPGDAPGNLGAVARIYLAARIRGLKKP